MLASFGSLHAASISSADGWGFGKLTPSLRSGGEALCSTVLSQARSLEDRLAGPLLDERLHPRPAVLGREDGCEQVRLQPQAGREVGVQPALDGRLGGRQRE